MSDPRHRNVPFNYLVRTKLDYGSDLSSVGPLDKEYKRRQRQPEVAAAVVAQAAAPVQPVVIGGTTGGTKITPAQLGPDRWHKRSVSTLGGYISVGHDHDLADAAEVAQTPPKNPGYAPLGVASSIRAAYDEAARLKPLVKGRIVIEVHGGIWFEDVTVAVAGIDFQGIGQPTIVGLVQRFAPSDAQFRDMDFIATNPVFGAMHFGPGPDMEPVAPLGGLFGCRFYGDSVASTFETRFYAENCHWFQTSSAFGVSESAVPLIVRANGGEAGESRMKNCSVHSWYRTPDVPMGRWPGGYAIFASCLSPGPGATAYQWPQSMLVLDNCDIYGSLLCQEWLVEHRQCSVHGGVSVPSHSGGVYAVLRGRPLFSDSFIGYISGRTTLSNTTIHSNLIAMALPYTGAYPPGVLPSTFPGQAVIDIRNCVHLSRMFEGAAASPFVPTSVATISNVIQTATACAAWVASGWPVNTYGDCPVGVANGLFDYYLL